MSCPDRKEGDNIAFLACQPNEDSIVTIRTSDNNIVVILHTIFLDFGSFYFLIVRLAESLQIIDTL